MASEVKVSVGFSFTHPGNAGLVIKSVRAGSPAAVAGIQKGDLVVTVPFALHFSDSHSMH